MVFIIGLIFGFLLILYDFDDCECVFYLFLVVVHCGITDWSG